jgi:hypothetical protein
VKNLPWIHNSNWHKNGTDATASCWHKSVEVDAHYLEI